MSDDINIVELDQLFDPHPHSMSDEQFSAWLDQLEAFADEYGRDRVSAMLIELQQMTADHARAHLDRGDGDGLG
jgi:truncated hemoglobin YjbI